MKEYKYNYDELNMEERIACNILAMYTLLESANRVVTIKDIENELEEICKSYKRFGLVDVANEKLRKYKKNSKFSN